MLVERLQHEHALGQNSRQHSKAEAMRISQTNSNVVVLLKGMSGFYAR
jgi:hypothetical protein